MTQNTLKDYWILLNIKINITTNYEQQLFKTNLWVNWEWWSDLFQVQKTESEKRDEKKVVCVILCGSLCDDIDMILDCLFHF